MTYVDGFVAPILAGREEDYAVFAAKWAPVFLSFGAIQIIENIEDDVPDGKQTDMRRAVAAEPGEKIAFSWVVYPDKATRDAANARMQSDPMFEDMGDVPFDMRRMIFGGFRQIVNVAEG